MSLQILVSLAEVSLEYAGEHIGPGVRRSLDQVAGEGEFRSGELGEVLCRQLRIAGGGGHSGADRGGAAG